MKCVFTPSPKFTATRPSATFCSPSIYSLRSIHWYPSHLQYVKGSQITRGRPSGVEARDLGYGLCTLYFQLAAVCSAVLTELSQVT